ncbi:PAQR family membrane homeostasis protein TrhA [Allomuricauda sp. SCSIO 65647]|uniref:PAQR family membrane homeostasis protein TrhA n=1 Tax=Allomuricauda sp. SCSIO 65647 TaxID=2908843 RepID=UPI001F3F1FFB|nr:hemolysin III family protein [Muricauda sp. SCSIO 65647]UJH67956.1 hemolysin III family protein [Muricauda sp. SCSIO 65647]
MKSAKNQVLLEEKWNTYSHAFGVILSLVGMVILFSYDLFREPYLFASILVYSLSLVLLFSASTLYHLARNPKRKERLRILDHISIYYLIAGTYTPVCLLALQNGKGWLLFYLVWGIALFGTFLKLFFTGRFEAFSLILYGVMGWLIVIDLPYLLHNISSTGLLLLSLGGAFYTFGIFFYAMKRIPFNHLIWHLFVLCGAISHWLMIYVEVL